MSGWGTIYNNTINALGMHSKLLARLQEQGATGTRILRPSDDPSDASRILFLESQKSDTQTYIKNIDRVVCDLDQTTNIMRSISDTVTRVGTLLTQAANGTYGQTNRLSVSEEIDSLLEQVVSFANSKNIGKYIFGGAVTASKPYSVQRTNGRITSVTYQGSPQDMPVSVGPGVSFSGVVVGDSVFRSNDRSEPLFFGDTGAAASTATSSVRGDAWLTVAHQSTSYGGGSGIAPGTGSTADDTILGTGHELTVDAVAGTITLDGGSAVSFDGTETNLEVANATGDKVYVDTTAVVGGFQGTAAITTTGTLSIDDGDTTSPITFAANDAVVDSRTGKVLYVDSSAITRTGTEAIRVPGTYDVFSTLVNVRDLLRNERNLTADDQSNLISQAVEALDEVAAGLSRQQASLGSRLGSLDSLRTSLENRIDQTDMQTSLLEDADIVQIATDIARTQTLYEMSLATSSRLLSLSLLDFIR